MPGRYVASLIAFVVFGTAAPGAAQESPPSEPPAEWGVTAIDYSAASGLALAQLEAVCREILEDPEIHRVAAVHRTGHLVVGEASVVVAASAAHRRAAFRGAQRLIDRIKEVVPVWKHEHFVEGDSRWVPGQPPPTPSAVET